MPPFRSQAQLAKWKDLVTEGRVSQAQFDARLAETDQPDALPERAAPRPRTVGPSRAFQEQKLTNTRY
jgi:hypothetical protein